MSSVWSPVRRRRVEQPVGAPQSIVTSPPTTTISSVTSGPAAATRNSAPGESVSRLIFITPPNRNSSIPDTSMPSRRAASACPSSCSRIEPKNSTAATTATLNAVVSDDASFSLERPLEQVDEEEQHDEPGRR